MPTKRDILKVITRESLLEFAKAADVSGLSGKSKIEIVDALAAAKRARLRDFLPTLPRNILKNVCESCGLDNTGREKQLLIDRLIGEEPAEPVESEANPQAPREPLAVLPPAIKKRQPIDDYRHDEATRKNIPPAKIAAEGKVPAKPKVQYSYHPRLPPVLRFDSYGEHDDIPKSLEDIIRIAQKRPLTEDEAKALAIALRNEPWLEWAGKRELPGFAVDPVALHIHERVSAQAILRIAARQDVTRDLFADPEQDYRDAVQFYRHDIDWSNRLILGDSLQVMASLAKREDLAGKVQMIYIDPPYGIKFASNFQPEVGKRDVKDKEQDLTREPEMVKAFRDTWHLGIHSYLSYLRDRLILAREMLTDSGSVFVQISDENLHRVHQIVDEILGPDNFRSIISFKKTGGLDTKGLSTVSDFVIWYAKNAEELKYRQQFAERASSDSDPGVFRYYLSQSGWWASLTQVEDNDASAGERFQSVSLSSQGFSPGTSIPYRFNGIKFHPPHNRHWTTGELGNDRRRDNSNWRRPRSPVR